MTCVQQHMLPGCNGEDDELTVDAVFFCRWRRRQAAGNWQSRAGVLVDPATRWPVDVKVKTPFRLSDQRFYQIPCVRTPWPIGGKSGSPA